MKINTLSFIYSGKWSNITYLWVAKVCESLGLAVNLKVKLESICSEMFSVSGMSVLFKEQGSIKVWSCLWKWIMARTKEISEDLRKRVVVAHQAGKCYKTIYKEFRQIVYKWRKFKTTVTLPRSGPPTKITLKARRVIVREVAKDLRVTSKQLKAFLTLADVNVHESTIRRTLEKESRRKPLLM